MTEKYIKIDQQNQVLKNSNFENFQVKSEVFESSLECTNIIINVGLCGFQDRLQYSLTGDATAREYFYVNRDTAEIILIKNLDTTTVKTFNVGIISVQTYLTQLKSDQWA